jgi:hypothetical protein
VNPNGLILSFHSSRVSLYRFPNEVATSICGRCAALVTSILRSLLLNSINAICFVLKTRAQKNLEDLKKVRNDDVDLASKLSRMCKQPHGKKVESIEIKKEA